MAIHKKRKELEDDEPVQGKRTDVLAALAEIDDIFGDAEEKSFSEVEPGKYQVRIDKATINHSKASGRLQVSWELTIANGDFKGRKLWKHDGLDNEESIGWFKGGMARLGVDSPKSAKKLPPVLEELIGTYAEVAVRSKKDKKGEDRLNTYFNKALDDDEVDEDLDEIDGEEAEAEEEAPAKKAKPKRRVVETEEDEEEAEDADDETEEAEEDEAEEAPVKKVVKKAKPKKEDEAEEEEDEDAEEGEEADAEEEEAEAPAAKKGKPKRRVAEAEEAEAPKSPSRTTSGSASGKSSTPTETKVTFDDDDLDDDQKALILKTAKKIGFDPEDYDTTTDLLLDCAEDRKVFGKFSDPTKLIKAVRAA